MTVVSTSRQYFYSAGKRKTAIARVRLFQDGSGQARINNMPLKEYFSGMQVENAVAPLLLIGQKSKFDVEAFVEGGGKPAQSDAVRLGISRALLLVSPELRSDLKRAGFLRRDSRIKERKKPGLHRARRAPQFSKR
jgi:small subunit ribosomal protein S9